MTPQPLPILRAGFEGSGSPRWLMRTIQRSGLDRAHGFVLDLVTVPEGQHRHGTLTPLADGTVDLVDADQLALARARDDGLAVTAVAPYGRIYGSLVARRGWAPERDGLATLAGARLGVLAHGDKNWTLLDTTVRRQYDLGLGELVRSEGFARRDDLIAALDAGRIDVALAHWHLAPRLLAAGHRSIAELSELADRAGLPDAATTHFVMREAAAERTTDGTLAAAFRAALRAAAGHLAGDDAPWRALADDGAFAAALVPALKPRWQARVGRYLTIESAWRTPT